MRGAHAFSVLNRGGDVQQAIARVEKFHFNYRDITDFDRVAKRAIPFWTFYSRNAALQAQVWTKMPSKLNRSYFNVKRNLEYQVSRGDGEDVPEWMKQFGIRVGENSDGSTTWMFMPDLPSIRFMDDVKDLTTTSDGGRGLNLVSVVNDMAFPIQAGAKISTGRDPFTNADYDRRLVESDGAGGLQPRTAIAPMDWLSRVPGAGPVLGQVPGYDWRGGQLVATDLASDLTQDAFPLLSRFNRLMPNSGRYQDRQLSSVLSTLGVPLRQVTQRDRTGAESARFYDQLDARNRLVRNLEESAVLDG